MKQLFIRTIAFSALFVLAFAFTPVVTFAHAGEDHANAREAEVHEAELFKEEAKDRAKTRLNEAKKRVCENRSKNIKNIMARSVARAENQTKLFTNIADRVKAFYEKQGKTLANYDELVAAVDDAKTTVAADVAVLKEAANFDCDSDDPKGEAEAFKEAQKQVNASLKEFRTAVKNLIVGVRTAQSQGGAQ